MKKRLTIVGLFVLCLFMPFPAFCAAFSALVAFGDSLSDNGNLHALTGGLIPDHTHYFNGRFSNGPVWVDYLAQHLGLDENLHDEAYGGATTGGVIPPGLRAQVQHYVASSAIPPNALFTVWAGANDLFSSSDHEAAVNNIITALDMLVRAGAQNFLVLNLPNLGLTPQMNASFDMFNAGATLTRAFNQALEISIDLFASENPGVILYFLDVFSLLSDVVSDPVRYGFSNTDAPCPNFGISFQNNERCLFWDEIHPTTEAHELLAARAAALVTATTDPFIEIRANGSSNPITVSPETPVSLTVSILPGQQQGRHADIWIVAATPLGYYSYVYPAGWMSGVSVSAQVPLLDLWHLEVLTAHLPAGNYRFYFGIDDNADGVPDGHWLDIVDVDVQG